jgi:hypothetical protein
MPLVLAVRRLPYTVRGSYASLLLVHPSMEEAAASVGATGLRSFRDITLPMIWKGVLVGSLFSFMTSLQEASAVLFLALGGWESITNGIFAFYIAGAPTGRGPGHPDPRGGRHDDRGQLVGGRPYGRRVRMRRIYPGQVVSTRRGTRRY